MAKDGETKEALSKRLSKLVNRTIQRNIKGVEYFASTAPPVGLTPKETIYKRGTLNLYHYHTQADELYRVPILLVMATTNRGYVMDITPGGSLVEFLVKNGYDVFMLDWDAPRPEEKVLGLDDYTQDFIPACIDQIRGVTGVEDVTVIGYCMGGVLSTIYAATHPDGPLKNLVCFTTPINWHEMGLFNAWSDKNVLDVDRLVDMVGNVPADLIMSSFDMLRPTSKITGRIDLWDNLWNDQYVESYRKFDRWANEALPLPGEYFKQVTKDLMRGNKLYKGELMVGGKNANLSNIKVPLLHAVAEHDHIIQREASAPLVELVGSEDKEELVMKGGHISLVAGPNAVRRLWPKLDEWLSVRSV
ncbi:MAG: alpha/beta fold hydrolase [Pseudomonadota bacterium]